MSIDAKNPKINNVEKYAKLKKALIWNLAQTEIILLVKINTALTLLAISPFISPQHQTYNLNNNLNYLITVKIYLNIVTHRLYVVCKGLIHKNMVKAAVKMMTPKVTSAPTQFLKAFLSKP